MFVNELHQIVQTAQLGAVQPGYALSVAIASCKFPKVSVK